MDITEDIAKASPVATVTGMSIYGVALPDIVHILTILYIGILIIDKGWALYKRWKRAHGDKE